MRRSVLLVHDMQDYFLAAYELDASPCRELVANIATLVAAAERAGVPVVFTAQPGDQTPAARGLLWDFWGPGIRSRSAGVIAELAPSPSAVVMVKHRYSAFHRTELSALLGRHARDQLVVCGVYAHIGVAATACDAFMLDVAPFVVADAVADFSAEHHARALTDVAGQCALVTTTTGVVDDWQA